MARPQHSPRSRLRVQSHVNDNHCVNSVTGQKNSVCVTGQTGLNPPPTIAGDKKVTLNVDFYCVNTSYPMDNSLSGRRRPARQTSEKDVLCLH